MKTACRKATLCILWLSVFQLVAWRLGRDDYERLSVRLAPRFSTTFGCVSADDDTYWGVGYTIVAHKRVFLTEGDKGIKGLRLVGPQLWYWIPFCNFPGPDASLELE